MMADSRCATASPSPVLISSINQLPASVLVHILSFLDIEDKCCAAMVCKLWSQLAKEQYLWKRLAITEMNLTNKIRLSLMSFFNTYIGNSLQKLKSTVMDNTLLRYLGSNCPNLKELTLFESDLTFCKMSLIPSSLTLLEIHEDGEEPEKYYPQDWFVSFTQDHFPHLKNLKFTRAPRCNAAIKQVTCLKSLRSLQMSSLKWGISDDAFSALMGMEDLESLGLIGMERFPADYAIQIVRNLYRLKEINLTRCEDLVVSSDLRRLAELPNLEKLMIPSKNTKFMKALIRVIPTMLKLKEVHFDDEDYYTGDYAPKDFVELLVTLQQLIPEISFHFRGVKVCEDNYDHFNRYLPDDLSGSDSSDNDM